jgi:hypothetical protein
VSTHFTGQAKRRQLAGGGEEMPAQNVQQEKSKKLKTATYPGYDKGAAIH